MERECSKEENNIAIYKRKEFKVEHAD